MNVVDYKHGKGVEVSAENNPQMMLYALGALEIFDCIYDIDEIRLTIFQPRLGNISVGGMNKAALLEWADGELKERAKLAYEGGGEYACGEWCRFCRAKAVCRNGTEENLKMARYDFAPADTLDETEIAAILDRADELASWVTDVKEYALSQTLRGVRYPGYKVVEGRSARKHSNDEFAASVVSGAGFDPYARKILGITEMQKLLGKEKFNELLSSLIVKPQGKPVLVPESDKRKPMNTADNDFKEEN